MRPGTNSRNDVDIRETLLARSSNLGEIDAGFAESDVAGFSARARVAHDKGTKNARRCLATMILALVAIVLAVVTGSALGTWFSLAMIGFAGAAILYETQVILRETPPGRETVAAMALFSSLALMFWYVLRLLMSRR